MEGNTLSVKIFKMGSIAVLGIMLIAGVACSSGTSEDTGAASGEIGVESMMAVHDPSVFDSMNGDYSKKTCLSCHPRETISAATEDLLGQEGFNPHKAHTESYDCIKCHSIDSTSVLVCNTACHGGKHGDGAGWQIPEAGWMSPTDEMPSADGEGI